MQPWSISLLQGYPGWWQVLCVAIIGSVAMTWFGYRLAIKLGLALPPRERDIHDTKKPRIGGVAMLTAFMLIFYGIILTASDSSWFTVTGQQFYGLDRAYWGVGIGLIVIMIFGLWDDLRDLKPGWQLLAQAMAALALVWGNIQVPFVRIPFGADVALNTTMLHWPAVLGGGQIGLWSAVFTVIWTVVVINVVNLFDGLDGLAGSVASTAAVVLAIVCLRLGLIGPMVMALILAGVAIGFLFFNWYPSRLFMGTVGSQMLGYLLAVIAIISGAKVATAVLVLGIPVLDALVVVIRRIAAGVSPLQGDQRHLHHRLLRIGLSTPVVVVVITSMSVLFGGLALATSTAEQKAYITVGLLVSMVGFIAVTYILERMKTTRNE
jgi:UDP-GlcNAc:undecaprenyl-phosphate/decaprenyl-phosphate GlcNAc-1-phosphate transferase